MPGGAEAAETGLGCSARRMRLGGPRCHRNASGGVEGEEGGALSACRPMDPHKNAADVDRQHCIRESLSVREELAATAKNQADEAHAHESQSAGLRYDVKVQIVEVEIFYIIAA